jgi:hypothetical protein
MTYQTRESYTNLSSYSQTKLLQADEKLAAANQSLEVTRRQKSEQDARYRYTSIVYVITYV